MRELFNEGIVQEEQDQYKCCSHLIFRYNPVILAGCAHVITQFLLYLIIVHVQSVSTSVSCLIVQIFHQRFDVMLRVLVSLALVAAISANEIARYRYSSRELLTQYCLVIVVVMLAVTVLVVKVVVKVSHCKHP